MLLLRGPQMSGPWPSSSRRRQSGAERVSEDYLYQQSIGIIVVIVVFPRHTPTIIRLKQKPVIDAAMVLAPVDAAPLWVETNLSTDQFLPSSPLILIGPSSSLLSDTAQFIEKMRNRYQPGKLASRRCHEQQQ